MNHDLELFDSLPLLPQLPRLERFHKDISVSQNSLDRVYGFVKVVVVVVALADV